jgi:hypothetical protein
MLDNGAQARFAKSCTDAAFGYARAANAAYVAAATQTIEFWSDAAREASRSTESRSRANDNSSVLDLWPEQVRDFWRNAANPWAAMGAMPTGAPAAQAAQRMAMQHMTAWWGMFPLQGAPASWPGAYALMTAGVPKEVAWPTAEANVAVLEAAQAATQQIEQINGAFASYRTETGFATSQMSATQSAMAVLMMAPLMAAMSAMPAAAYHGAGL